MISKATLEKIKKIVERNYRALAMGRYLQLVYLHNLRNEADAGPQSIAEIEAQLKASPIKLDQHNAIAVEHLNDNIEHLIEKLRSTAQTSIEGVVREYNLETRNRMIRGIAESKASESVGELKRKLRDIAGDGTRDFKRIAVTETANAIGLGSVDRVVAANKGADLGEVYVLRLITPDAATCKWCRRFFQDADGTPAVYRLSTLLGNGSNYGLKTSEWKPVVGAVHPNERCSPLIQVKKGWKVQPGGKLDWMGLEGWEEYIAGKVRA